MRGRTLSTAVCAAPVENDFAPNLNQQKTRHMNYKNIIKSVLASLVALTMMACEDTDAQYTIPSVDAPSLVKASPDQAAVLKPGMQTLKLTFDKRVFFASANASKVTLNGTAVTSADVIGSDSTLVVTADVPAEKTVTLDIPAGLLLGPEKTPAGEIQVVWNGTVIKVTQNLANTSANDDAKALYKLLYDNYGSKIFTGVMADVNWNTKNAEAVHTLTGKYPAIACFDYIHIQYSGSWVNYDDLTPVTDWHAKGGIVANMWHWLVPTQPLSADVTSMPSDWSGNLQLTDAASKAILANAQAGDKIVVHYKNASGAQGSFKDSNWAGLTDNTGKSYDYFDIGAYAKVGNVEVTGATYTLTLDAKSAEKVKNGVIVAGHDYTVESVNYVAKGKEEMTYRPDETTFDAAKVLTDGTIENKTMRRDLAEMAARLKALQDKGIAVLWRPLHEASGNAELGGTAWFWWGAAGADTFKQLWQYMFTYFQQQGVNNLVWVWTGADYDSNWYPGDEYVDIVGADIYSVSSAADIAKTFNDMQINYPTKMITLSECGAVAGISDIWNAGGTWSWFMPWYGDYKEGVPQASDDWWKAVMASDNVITLDDLK